VVEAFLAFMAAQMKAEEVAERVSEENAVEEISVRVGAMIYASRTALPFDAFRLMISST
jgi:hypothetical protein